MRLTHIILVAGLISLGATEPPHNLTNVDLENLEYRNLTLSARGDNDDSDDSPFDYSPSPAPLPADDELWHDSKCRGAKLMLATTQNPPEAERFISPLASPWDGEMRHELAIWGYKEGIKSPDSFTFGAIQPLLDSMGISSQISLYGGPNYCYSLYHGDSDIVERDPHGNLPSVSDQHYTVNGRRYRVTGAHSTMIMNPESGYILFVSRGSAEQEARETWGLGEEDPVPLDELPALRASSDIAWALWKRTTDKLAKITFFASLLITNGETKRIIVRVLERRTMTVVPVWPGMLVDITSEDYLALLGTPNGRGIGYFLAQHKAQIGGNLYVKSIRIYRARESSSLSNMIFIVGWAPSPPPPVPNEPIEVLVPPIASGMEDFTNMYGNGVTKRSDDGKNLVRNHKIWIKL